MNEDINAKDELQDVKQESYNVLQPSATVSMDVDSKEASPGGFMKAEDEDLEKQRRQGSAEKRVIKGDAGSNHEVERAPTVARSAKEASSDENSISATTSSTSSSTSPGKPTNLTVSTDNANGRRNSSSPSNAGRIMPARKSSPPPTPPARLSSSEGGSGSFLGSGTRIPKRKSSSPASASSSRLQAVTSSSSSPPPGSASMKRSSSPLVAGTIGKAGNSESPPSKKQARAERSSSPPLESTTLRVRDAEGVKAKSRSPSPGSSQEHSNRPARSSSPKSDRSSSPSSPPIGPQPDTTSEQPQSNGSSSPPPSSDDDSSSSPVKPAPQSPRRVKIYALFDSNWIDLGTGSCTYHEGIAHRKRRKIGKGPSAVSKEPPPSPPGTKSGLSIAGRAARDAKNRRAAEEELEMEYVEEVQLVDISDGLIPPGIFGDGISEIEEEEAAWIEIEKEGRWKSDPPAPDSKKAKKARQAKKEKKAARDSKQGKKSSKEHGEDESTKEDDDIAADNSSDDDDDDDMEEDGGPDYERIWQSRIERPIPDALGLIDYDSFSLHTGAEGENEEVIGRYRRQQETLIVWKSSTIPLSFSSVMDIEADEMEFALSFAATSGCAEVWEFLKGVHGTWQATFSDMQEEDVDGDTLGASNTTSNASQTGSTFGTGAFGNGGQFGLGIGAMGNASAPLPPPELSNLEECEARIKFGSRTAVGREKLAAGILRTSFIKKMFNSFREAEDLESIQDLHLLCSLLHDILNLNDQQLWEYVLSDDIFFDAVSILEYDPDFPTMKASYRTHLSDPSLFVEVVPINNPSIEEKIHQIYRLQYLKDVILPRVLDDSAFTIINSFIYFHQVDIVQYLFGNERFWNELFALFPGAEGPAVGPRSTAKEEEEAKKKKSGKKPINGASPEIGPSKPSLPVGEVTSKQMDAISFLQSYAQMVKQLQPGMRTTSFRKLSEVGLLRIIAYSLTTAKMQDIQAIRVATVEILMLMVDHDTSSIRTFVLKQHEQGKKKTLMLALVQAFEKEQELGIKAQLAEAIRVLVLPPGDVSATETAAARTRPDDPNADKFLQYFYDHCIQELFKPLNKGLESPAEDTVELDLTPVQIALYTHLCDLLCFFVVQHVFRSKVFITSTPVCEKVALLLRAKPKHVRLAALRYFRACLGRNDAFYFRSLIKNNVFPPILRLTAAELKANNLLSSACLELFEYLRTSNVKPILNHLMETSEQEIRTLALDFPNFRMLVARWEQNNEPLPSKEEEPPSSSDTAAQGEPSSSIAGDLPTTTIKSDERSLTLEEEKYFDAEDDDEEASTKTSSLKRSEPSTLLSRFTHGKDAQEADSNILRRKRQKMDDSSASPTGKNMQTSEAADPEASASSSTPSDETVSTPADSDTDPDQELARIREKRKRAEEEEEGEDMLAKKKTPATEKEKGKKAGLSGATAGKFKLLFGKKSSQ